MSEYLLEMREITKKYPGVLALNNVEMKVKRGSIHALVGENGAGKSTLVKVLSGFAKPDSGEIIFDGNKLEIKGAIDAMDKGIVIIHQELNLVPEMTIAENIFLGREPLRRRFIQDKVMIEEAQRLLDDYQMNLSAKMQVKNLSVSQRQMIEIIKAVSRDAKIILMDEPTSAISASEVETLFKAIHQLISRGVTIIYISHRMDEIFRIADTVTVLRDGNNIGTYDIGELNKNKVIALMVGREIQDIYPPKAEKMGETVLRVNNLCKHKVFKDISLYAKEGEVVGIAGLMGAGRTEVARCLFGLDHYDSGEIFMFEKKVRIKSSRNAINCGIAMATEDRAKYGLVLMRSIRENIALPNLDSFTKVGLINKRKEDEAIDFASKAFAIKAQNSDIEANNLSGGNQQKVVFAKWILASPKLLILDEPTRGIDVGAKFEIYKIIRDLTKKGMSIIFISSELPELIGMSDRVYVMKRGMISAELKGEKITQIEIMNYATENVI